MIHDADPRIKPKKALILNTIRSDDGEIRSCIGSNESIRPVNSFRDLELNVYDHYKLLDSDGMGHKVDVNTATKLLDSDGSNIVGPDLTVVGDEVPLLSPIPPRVERRSKIDARCKIGAY
ncbi:unnamed protein product [Meganyctiphanes norvegica]|uniref:Uncharacterized protein n=1 Tax=Meganyctiphanes norvegica TaxID=48144 RepID=A0AAV2R811_MEGNR